MKHHRIEEMRELIAETIERKLAGETSAARRIIMLKKMMVDQGVVLMEHHGLLHVLVDTPLRDKLEGVEINGESLIDVIERMMPCRDTDEHDHPHHMPESCSARVH